MLTSITVTPKPKKNISCLWSLTAHLVHTTVIQHHIKVPAPPDCSYLITLLHVYCGAFLAQMYDISLAYNYASYAEVFTCIVMQKLC